MGKRYTFVLNFGYVESQSLSFMPWVSNKQYKDAKEALIDLATFFKEQYLEGTHLVLKKCCRSTKDKDLDAKFCSKCGGPLEEDGMEGEIFIDWLRNMSVQDNNGMGDFVEWDKTHRWQYGQLEGSPNQRFVYQAEWVLASALGYDHYDGRTFEKICKERTKSKKESFSYF